jgi:hypothetical protein
MKNKNNVDCGLAKAGFSATSGKVNQFVSLASKLVILPALNAYDQLWNTRLQIAVEDEDLDTLLDMNQIVMRRK